MDISKIDVVGASNNGVTVDIINPSTNEALGLSIVVVGAMSTNYKDDMAMLYAELEDYTEQNKVADDASRKDKAKANIKINKYDEELTAKFLAKYTKSWYGMVENGKEIPFSEKEAERIYLEYPIIRGQVQKAMLDISNFFKA